MSWHKREWLRLGTSLARLGAVIIGGKDKQSAAIIREAANEAERIQQARDKHDADDFVQAVEDRKTRPLDK